MTRPVFDVRAAAMRKSAWASEIGGGCAMEKNQSTGFDLGANRQIYLIQ